MQSLIHVLLLVTFMIAQPFAAAAQSLDKTRDWYRTNGVTVVNPPQSAPMSFKGVNGQPSGFVVDIWRKWSNETGIPVKFRFAPWAQTLDLVASGECDIHGGLFFNEERAEFLDFSQPYRPIQAALLIDREKDADINTIYGKYSIGVLNKGYAAYFLQKNYPESKLMRYSTEGDLARGFIEGEIQALAGDHPTMGYEAGRLGIGNRLMVKEILYTQNMHGATAKGNGVLLEIMNEGLARIDEEERQMIFNRWFVSETEDSHLTMTYILIGAILLLGLGALFYFDSLTLRRMRNKK